MSPSVTVEAGSGLEPAAASSVLEPSSPRSSSPRAAVVSAPAHVTSAVIAGGGQAVPTTTHLAKPDRVEDVRRSQDKEEEESRAWAFWRN